MTRTRLIAVVLAAAGAAACSSGSHDDPCAYRTGGAPWLAFSSAEDGGWDIHLVRADGTCRRPLTTDGAGSVNPAWAPGGVVAFQSERSALTSVWLAQVDGGAARRVDVGASLVAMRPAISPDGATLAFEGRYVGSTVDSIFVVPVAGGAPVERLPAGAGYGNAFPTFSPDGASLYFVSGRSGAFEIWKAPVAGGLDPVQVTTGSHVIGKLSVSPDGALLAFAQHTADGDQVVLFDPVHGTSTALGLPTSSEPTFDPAGGRLAVRVLRTAPSGHVTANLDLAPLPAGSPSSRVTTGPGPDGAPAFDRLGH